MGKNLFLIFGQPEENEKETGSGLMNANDYFKASVATAYSVMVGFPPHIMKRYDYEAFCRGLVKDAGEAIANGDYSGCDDFELYDSEDSFAMQTEEEIEMLDKIFGWDKDVDDDGYTFRTKREQDYYDGIFDDPDDFI